MPAAVMTDNTPRKSTPGHGGARPNAGGARPGAGRKPRDQENTRSKNTVDAYVILAKAKAKRETHLAQLAELDYKERTRELLNAEEVATAWTDRVLIAKGRLLSMPARLAPAVIGKTDLRAIEQTIRDEIITVLEELARDDVQS